MSNHGKNSNQPHEDTVEVSGRVLQANVRQRQCQVWLDDDTHVFVAFTEEQEPRVVSALRDHKHTCVVVSGIGQLTPEGKPNGVIRADSLVLRPREPRPFDPTAPNIMDKIAEITKDVPDEEWEKLPTDLSHRLDYYLYGIERE